MVILKQGLRAGREILFQIIQQGLKASARLIVPVARVDISKFRGPHAGLA